MANKASGIQLAPVRMGDLIPSHLAQTTTKLAAATKPKVGYVPPHMRQGTAASDSVMLPEKISLVETDFPTMGSFSPATSKSPKSPAINFKKAVDDHLEREKLTEAERLKAPEQDPLKMTKEQLEEEGWIALPMDLSYYKGPPSCIQDQDQEQDNFTAYDYASASKSLSAMMEEEAEQVFNSYKQVNTESAFKFAQHKKSPTPLNDACLRYSRAKAN